MKRSNKNLSSYSLRDMSFGQLVPVLAEEVLPGDSFRHSTSALIRLIPQLKPVMHPTNVHIHHFFVPNRLVWSGWEDFITGVDATPPPTLTTNLTGSVADHMGCSSGTITNTYDAMKVRAYNLIYNEFYRDKDLTPEVDEDSTTLQRVAWEKDYYTTARPTPQEGEAVTIPMEIIDETAQPKLIQTVARTKGTGAVGGETSTGDFQMTSGPDLQFDPNGSIGADARDFREGFAMLRYKEARNKYGSSYVDYLRYCGVNPSDSRLQRPEFLGGGKQQISFSEVLGTSSATGGTLGEMAGHGIAALRSNAYTRYFEEHGHVITMIFIRPKSIYANGMDKKWFRTTKEDYYQKELAQIGDQEVLNKEVYDQHSDPEGVFGWQSRHAEYTFSKSFVTGNMRNTINYDHHLGRIFSSDPALNDTFVKCNPTSRVFASQSEPTVWCAVEHSLVAKRKVNVSTIGRVA